MNLLQVSEVCTICGEGLASLQQESYLGKILFYRECSFCTSEYAGAIETRLNILPHDDQIAVQSGLLNKE